MTNRRVRLAGGRWRLLVHEFAGRRPGSREGFYDVSHDVTNDPKAAKPATGNSRTHILPPTTEFDELVVGSWIHLEAMDTGFWWMNLAGVTIHITADRDGRPKHIDVQGPGDYDDPVDGCTYSLTWSADSPTTQEYCERPRGRGRSVQEDAREA